MKSSIKDDAATPGQVDRKERDVPSRGNTRAARDGVSPSRESTPRRSIRQIDLTRGTTQSLTSPSVLDYARRTQVDAQAHRTSVRRAELERKAQDEGRDDAVGEQVQEKPPSERAKLRRVEDSTTSYDGRVDCNIETSCLSLVAYQSYLFAPSVCRLL